MIRSYTIDLDLPADIEIFLHADTTGDDERAAGFGGRLRRIGDLDLFLEKGLPLVDERAGEGRIRIQVRIVDRIRNNFV